MTDVFFHVAQEINHLVRPLLNLSVLAESIKNEFADQLSGEGHHLLAVRHEHGVNSSELLEIHSGIFPLEQLPAVPSLLKLVASVNEGPGGVPIWGLLPTMTMICGLIGPSSEQYPMRDGIGSQRDQGAGKLGRCSAQ